MPIIDILLSAWDNFLNNRGIGKVQASRPYRMEPFKTTSIEPKKLSVALFGANPNEAFGLDWASYRSPKPQGPATTPQSLQSELKSVDSDAGLETWKPDPSKPSLTSHGRVLNYQNQSDQRPVLSFSGTIDEKWDGIVRSTEPKKSMETSPRGHDKTEGDRQGEDLRRYPFDFST